MDNNGSEPVMSKEEQFFEAIGADDAERVGAFLEEGVDLGQRTGYAPEWSTLGADALSSAVSSGALGAARVLLDAGVSPNAVSHGKGVLYQATTFGQIDSLRLLVEAGADLHSDHAAWAAEYAAADGRLDMLELLVAHGFDVNSQPDPESWTALLGAASRGHTEIVRYLLEQGADPSRETVRRNKDGTVDILTPRSVAVEAGHDEVVALLDRFAAPQRPEPAPPSSGR